MGSLCSPSAIDSVDGCCDLAGVVSAEEGGEGADISGDAEAC
jgi:hypothetical protein